MARSARVSGGMARSVRVLGGPGPLRVDDVATGSRYELQDGHPIYCAPTGGDGSRGTVAGAEVLDTDPDVEEAGLDAGYSLDSGTLRAPDVAVGNVPDRPGWIRGTPPLALEYSSVGQDEESLQRKIADLLAAGTRWVWVVRLVGPRRVEVHEKGQPAKTYGPGEELRAPGVLRNRVPVEALYDRRTAHRLTLRNLLQRAGYESLDAVRGEGRGEGREEGRAAAILAILEARGVELTDDARARISTCRDSSQLDLWLRRAAHATHSADVLGESP